MLKNDFLHAQWFFLDHGGHRLYRHYVHAPTVPWWVWLGSPVGRWTRKFFVLKNFGRFFSPDRTETPCAAPPNPHQCTKSTWPPKRTFKSCAIFYIFGLFFELLCYFLVIEINEPLDRPHVPNTEPFVGQWIRTGIFMSIKTHEWLEGKRSINFKIAQKYAQTKKIWPDKEYGQTKNWPKNHCQVKNMQKMWS